VSISVFLTRRYLRNRKEAKNFSFLSLIAIAGIALGTATLIIALSLLNGFEKLIAEKLVAIDSHIQIYGYDDRPLTFPLSTELKIKAIVGEELSTLTTSISKLAIASKGKIKDGITVKGVHNDFFSNASLSIVQGVAPENGKQELLIGKTVAAKFRVKPGDEITIFALRGRGLPSAEEPPVVGKFVISGIFESGMARFDDSFAYTSLQDAATLFEMGNDVTGFEIRINNIAKVDSISNLLQETLPHPHYVRSVFQMNRHIFNWIELQKKPIPIVLGLIILVAVFNIISTILMLVLEKTHSIGILSSLGLQPKSISRIFLFQGIIIGIVGVSIGNLIAYLLMLLQNTYHIISLPAQLYFVSEPPLLVEWQTFALVTIITLPLVIITAYLPARIASKINPITALRFG